MIGDVLFALQVNIVRCPLNLQENTTLPVNQTNQNATSGAGAGASSIVTTGAGQQTGGTVITNLDSLFQLEESLDQLPEA